MFLLWQFISSIILSGAYITGNGGPATIGSSLQLTCSSDMVALMAEWLYNDVVIAQSATGNVTLMISSVNDSLHNREYKCRITTPFGVQERNSTIITTGMPIEKLQSFLRTLC